jgi:transcriptional regulator with XRE-family HTH domain
MSVRRTGTTRAEYEADRREHELRRAIAEELRRVIEDAGITQAALARASHLSEAQISRLLGGRESASLHALAAIAVGLDARLRFILDPVTGPRIRDRFQARIGEALLRLAHLRWKRFLEVIIHRPRGMIDVVFHDPTASEIVATEIASRINRFEQLQRWANENAAALLTSSDLPLRQQSAGPPRSSRLLVLRSTAATRALANELEESFRAAYPARSEDAYLALLTADHPWPGSAILWATVEGNAVEILREPPRGVRVGR